MLFLPMSLAVFSVTVFFHTDNRCNLRTPPPLLSTPLPSPALPGSGLQEMISRKTGSSLKSWSRSGHVKKIIFVDTVVFSEKRLAKLVFFSWSSSGKTRRGLLECLFV